MPQHVPTPEPADPVAALCNLGVEAIEAAAKTTGMRPLVIVTVVRVADRVDGVNVATSCSVADELELLGGDGMPLAELEATLEQTLRSVRIAAGRQAA